MIFTCSVTRYVTLVSIDLGVSYTLPSWSRSSKGCRKMTATARWAWLFPRNIHGICYIYHTFPARLNVGISLAYSGKSSILPRICQVYSLHILDIRPPNILPALGELILLPGGIPAALIVCIVHTDSNRTDLYIY